MSSASEQHDSVRGRKSATNRVIQAAALLIIFGVLLVTTRLTPHSKSVVGTIAGLGFLLLAGTLFSELVEIVSLPHLSGYLFAGVVAGPHVLSLIDQDTLDRLLPVNGLALSLIALAGGAELGVSMLRAGARSIAWATLLQHTIVLLVGFFSFLLLAPYTPFSRLPPQGIFAVAVLWGVISATRSPAALLGIIAQLRPAGPLTTFSIAFVMLSDVVCIILAALAITFVKPLLDPVASLSFAEIKHLGYELVGSVALGTCLGIALAAYLKLIDKNRLVVLLVIGVSLSELLRYIQFDALLSFLVAGFYVRNFSDQGPKLLDAIHQTGVLVFVIFFAVAGASIDLGVLRTLGLVAAALAVIRAVFSIGTARLASRIAKDEPVIARWGWSSLISQSGLTLGLMVVIARMIPSIAVEFTTLTIGTVAINQVIGPILFKLGLERAGEAGAAARAEGP